MMCRFLAPSIVLLGGCLEINPVFVDPTEGGTQAGGTTGGGGPTSEPGTDSQPTSASDPTTTPPTTTPPTTDEPGETTSDPTTGPTVDTDGPNSSTMPGPYCGDNMKDPGEECDDGNLDPYGECPSECKKAYCGDGFVWVNGEECDDANNIDDDKCSNLCIASYCGDKIKQMDEECDDGNVINSDACVSCKIAFCGDFEVHQGVEDCDDGNDAPGDGCEPKDCKKTVKIVFVTSMAYPVGQVGGLMGANTKCESLAMMAGLPPGPYYAWLGDGAMLGPKNHFITKSQYPYVKTNMAMVAMNWTGLISGDLLSPIDITEKKMAATDIGHPCGPNTVHTNAKPDGDVLSKVDDCGKWMSDVGKGGWGSWKSTGAEWTDNCGGAYCNAPARLYCVQQ